jgi:hypothetical protein
MVSANREPLIGFLARAEEGEEEGHISTVVVSDLRFRPVASSISSSPSLRPLTLEAKYVLLRPLTFVSMEAVDVDTSRGLGHTGSGSGDEYTVAGVSGTAEEREDDIELESDTVVEEKLVLRGRRSREDDGLEGGLGGGRYRSCDWGLGEF